MNPTKLLVCLSVILTTVFNNATYSQDISSSEVVMDLKMLQKWILTYQPALSSYASNFESNSQRLIESVGKDSLTFLEENKLVSKMCVMAREGHFSVGTWEDTIHQSIMNNTSKFMPLDIVVLDGKVYVEKDYSNEQNLVAGSEILYINEQPIYKVLQDMLVCMPSDGNILTNVLSDLDYGFALNYYLFVDQSEQFNLELKKPNGIRHLASIAALTRKAQQANYKQFIGAETSQKNEHPVYSLTFTDNNAAALTLRTFNNNQLNKSKIKARKFYRALFDTINEQQPENLILDLRDNQGGRFKMASELVPYLMSETPSNRLERTSISWDGKERKYKFRKKSKHAFKGNVYVLVNGTTFSSASTLARYLKEETDAVIIGEETGSRYEGFAAGSKKYVYLPNSGIRVGIPCYLIDFGSGDKQQTSNRGVLPDHEVTYTIDHILTGTDMHYAKVLSLIKM